MSEHKTKKYLRMTLNERVQHFILMISFVVLVITGFALKFPESLWVQGFRNLFGENAFEMRGDVHRIAGVLLVIVSLYHLYYIFFTQRGKEFIKDMWPRKNDYTDMKDTIKFYRGKRDEKPKLGRFSYIEKLEYFAVYWGNFVMLLTGVLLWFENFFLPVISNVGMDIAAAIHFYEAILATLSIIFWHFYFVIYNPDVYPMNKAWLTGFITRHQMENEHPLWLEEIEKNDSNEKALTDEKVNSDENKPIESENKDTENESDKVTEKETETDQEIKEAEISDTENKRKDSHDSDQNIKNDLNT